MVSQAMFASTIAEYFVEKDHVRVELEIGLIDLAAFRNLFPDSIYTFRGLQLALPARHHSDSSFTITPFLLNRLQHFLSMGNKLSSPGATIAEGVRFQRPGR